MKSLILTITTMILITATTTTISAEAFNAPLDTIAQKSAKKCIFEMETSTKSIKTVELSNLSYSFLDDCIEEPSKPTSANLKPLPSKFTGYKVQIMNVYHQPLDETEAILFEYKEVMIERIGESQYAYLVGNFISEKEATEFLSKASNNNMKLIQYKNGLRVQ